MKLPLFILRVTYMLARRLQIAEATRLLYMKAADFRAPELADGYSMHSPSAEELSEWIQTGKAAEKTGSPQSISNQRRLVVATTRDNQVVSHLWIATESVDASDNFSRARHLGTSVDLPPRAGFLFNAWTHPDHRGKRLIGCMISHILENRLSETEVLVTTMDWTNERSCRAFAHVGMQPIGTVIRIGRGPLQLSLLPQTANQLGLKLARQAPGYKFAC
ncbi:signal peptide protein [Rhodopirellula maiorica SM1]|uniref:Signal peptide protein n=1 Tax=Rhodopirellula maiorica SM1 TaxID=1265738 RepID=M5RWN3_9BACT|nr:hypothetical protein [Rhodopirellula maiorica]EMI18349.1 signal peptide protein [Rhodopirellula maiorica SM1]